MFLYQAQGLRYVKYNGPHKTGYYQHFVWCCKANFKINPPRLKTKQDESCLYLFKCINYKREYQADLNTCLFWRYCFNRDYVMRCLNTNNFYFSFLLFFWFYINFLLIFFSFLFWIMKRHVILQSHDRSHDVTS